MKGRLVANEGKALGFDLMSTAFSPPLPVVFYLFVFSFA
jgi:hypothetical protein